MKIIDYTQKNLCASFAINTVPVAQTPQKIAANPALMVIT